MCVCVCMRLCMQHEPAPATTHISESLHGPWRPAPGIPSINNPAPFYFPNGTTLIYGYYLNETVSLIGCLHEARVLRVVRPHTGRTDVHRANTTDGPYVRYVYTHAPMHPMHPMHPCTHTPIYPYTHTHIHIHIHPYIHTPMHPYSYTHTLIHSYTHTQTPKKQKQ